MPTPHFVDDDTAIPPAKSNVPGFAVTRPNQMWSAADIDFTWGALDDLRTYDKRQPLTVKAFEAAGDWDEVARTGTDDTAALQAAVSAAAAIGQDLWLPPGNYRVTRRIVVTASKIRIRASAFAVIHFASDSLTTVPDAVATSTIQARSAFLVKDCHGVEFHGVHFVGGDNPEITNVNVGCGIYATRSTDGRVVNCTQRGGYALFAQDALDPLTGASGNTISVSSGVVTLANNGDPNLAFHPGMAGLDASISGSALNAGTFPVLRVLSSTQLQYLNPGAVAESGTSLAWRASDGDRGWVISGCVSDRCRGTLNTGSNSVVEHCTFRRPLTQDYAGIPISFMAGGGNVTAVVYGAVTNDLSGKYIKIAGATSGGNSGLFGPILSVVPSNGAIQGSITYANGSGVTELAPAATCTWFVANGEQVGRGAGASSITVSGGVVTFVAATNMFSSASVRKALRFVDAVNASNRGSYQIAQVVSPNTVRFCNPGAVAESFAGVVTVDGYDNRKGDSSVGPSISSTSTAVGTGLLTDGTRSMVAHAYAGRYLTDSAGIQWEIADNAATVFTLVGATAPAAGAYTVTAGSTHGSTHGIYYFAGREGIKIRDCHFFGIRTTCIKVSGSARPIRDVEVSGCSAVECGSFAILGADDSQLHETIRIHDNTVTNCAINRAGWNDQQAMGVLGAGSVQFESNQIRATRDNIFALTDAGAVGGFYAIFAGRFLRGISQPLEHLTCSRNMITTDGRSCRPERVAVTAIHVERVGQLAKWGTATGPSQITLSVSGGIVTLTDLQAALHPTDIGSSIETVFFADAGNNTTATVLSVSGTSTLTFANGSGVAGSQAAGTYRLKPKATNVAMRGGSCVIAENQISGYGSLGIETLACLAPHITRNVFNGMVTAISEDGSNGPYIVGNREITAGSTNARIRLTSRTSWPFIDDNLVTNGALTGDNAGTDGVLMAAHSDMGVAVDTGTSIDHPLQGKRGRSKTTGGKPEMVFAFGSEWVDGDKVEINGNTYTYKSNAPSGAFQFNGMTFGAGSNVNQDGITITKGLTDGDGGATTNGASRSGWTVADYGSGLSGTPATGHVWIRETGVDTTVGAGFVDQFDILNPTACVAMRNAVGGGSAFLEARGQADAGPLSKRFLVWSPAAQFSAGVMLAADNSVAATTLAGGWFAEKAAVNGGCCEVLKTINTHGGTEEVRWVIT